MEYSFLKGEYQMLKTILNIFLRIIGIILSIVLSFAITYLAILLATKYMEYVANKDI